MSLRVCSELTLRLQPWPFVAQVVIPRDLTTQEAERLCAFIMTLVQPLPQSHASEDK